jgi:cytochrome c-type biogenesis protein CcmH/NrfG
MRPEVAGTWRALGNAYRENAEFDRSREALERSVQLAPQHHPTYVDLAKTCLEVDDYAAAESAARSAIDLGNRSATASYCLGRSLLGQQRFADALVAFEECQRAIRQNPRRAPTFTPPLDELVEECKQQISQPVEPPPQVVPVERQPTEYQTGL